MINFKLHPLCNEYSQFWDINVSRLVSKQIKFTSFQRLEDIERVAKENYTGLVREIAVKGMVKRIVLDIVDQSAEVGEENVQAKKKAHQQNLRREKRRRKAQRNKINSSATGATAACFAARKEQFSRDMKEAAEHIIVKLLQQMESRESYLQRPDLNPVDSFLDIEEKLKKELREELGKFADHLIEGKFPSDEVKLLQKDDIIKSNQDIFREKIHENRKKNLINMSGVGLEKIHQLMEKFGLGKHYYPTIEERYEALIIDYMGSVENPPKYINLHHVDDEIGEFCQIFTFMCKLNFHLNHPVPKFLPTAPKFFLTQFAKTTAKTLEAIDFKTTFTNEIEIVKQMLQRHAHWLLPTLLENSRQKAAIEEIFQQCIREEYNDLMFNEVRVYRAALIGSFNVKALVEELGVVHPELKQHQEQFMSKFNLLSKQFIGISPSNKLGIPCFVNFSAMKQEFMKFLEEKTQESVEGDVEALD